MENIDDNLVALVKRHEEIAEKLATGHAGLGQDFAKVSKEYSDLSKIVDLIKKYWKANDSLKEYEDILKDNTADKDLKSMASEELETAKEDVIKLEHDLKVSLLPKDDADDLSVILEIRAGTGGDEAALFAANLYRMYEKYAELKGWNMEVIDVNDTGIGGYKEVVASVKGFGVYARLKFESGVHRVQRIPDTESNGRVHTSAATVVILPEAEDVNIEIDEKDLKIDVYRASGAGGQHVNKTESAVRITHIPTGTVVACQDGRSQHKNKEQAMKILKARIYDHQRQELDKKRANDRKSQVGSGDRSERIRTYNYPQGRVTDHRINMTVYSLEKYLEGEIDDMIDALITEDQSRKLAQVK